jgi:hypothetical protein
MTKSANGAFVSDIKKGSVHPPFGIIRLDGKLIGIGLLVTCIFIFKVI